MWFWRASENVAYEEMVEFTINGTERKMGRIIAAYEDKALIQVFEGTEGMSLKNTRTHLTGHPMEIALSDEILGRTFDGVGNPIDGLGPIDPEVKLNVNGLPLNPVTRQYPPELYPDRYLRHRRTDHPDPRPEAADLLRKRPAP